MLSLHHGRSKQAAGSHTSMVEPVQRAVAWLMNRVRVNHAEEGVRDGAPVFVKRRRASAPIIVWFANRFLALAHSGVRMFLQPTNGSPGKFIVPDCCIRVAQT